MVYFFFRVKTQYENMGDALINRELIALLCKHGDLTVSLHHRAPKGFENQVAAGHDHSMKRMSLLGYYCRLVWLAFVKRKPVYLFFNPGGYGGEINTKQYLAKHLVLFWICLLKIFNVKFCHIGVSYSNLGARHIKYLKRFSKLLDQHRLRDSLSLSAANAAGIKHQGMLPDLAFNLLYERRESESKADLAVISCRKSHEPCLDGLTKQIVSDLMASDAIRQVHFAYQVEFDEPYNRALWERSTPSECGSDLLNLSRSIQDARNVYRESQLVFSNRLHVLLLALSVGAIPVALVRHSENQKVIGIYRDLGLENLLVNRDEAKPPEIDQLLLFPSEKAQQIFSDARSQFEQFFVRLATSP